MTIRDIMKYIESEFSVINETPCELCGGSYVTEELSLHIVEGFPFDVCDCFCENCGNEKIFQFSAPFVVEDPNSINIKKLLN